MPTGPIKSYLWAFFIGSFCWIGLSAKSQQPNIILIMTDDMGFSDIGCYGSEIETPHLDALAKGGLKFSQFYNSSRCCPTRASLMTGLYAHQAGMGGMTGDKGAQHPGYRGHLNKNCMTIAEVLKTNGYLSVQTGKWHLGDKKEWWPSARGFDRTYGSPLGGGFYFNPANFRLKRNIVKNDVILYDDKKATPEGWYTTDVYTEEGFEVIDEAIEKDKPFFWYLAYNAPHYPLKAKEKDIQKYIGKYMKGWDAVREERLQKLKKLNLIKDHVSLSPREKGVPAWESLSEKEKISQDRIMATYAAMIDSIDQNIGKLIHKLKESNVYENTIIMYLHDNGGCAEGGTIGKNNKFLCGTEKSFAYCGKSWANVSNTPFKKFKKNIYEGGIATPFIVHWPKGILPSAVGTTVTQTSHIIDVMATAVDVSGSSYPKKYKGNVIYPLEGKSLSPIFKGDNIFREEPLFFEHAKNKGVRDGYWKLVSHKSDWALYNMKEDRSELIDRSSDYPEKVQSLLAKYQKWAKRCFVE